jgi:hypothetical protein
MTPLLVFPVLPVELYHVLLEPNEGEEPNEDEPNEDEELLEKEDLELDDRELRPPPARASTCAIQSKRKKEMKLIKRNLVINNRIFYILESISFFFASKSA